MSEPDAAAEAAVSIGFSRETIFAGMQEPAIKERVVREYAEAIGKGVFGSPFMIDNGEPCCGSDRLDLIARQ